MDKINCIEDYFAGIRAYYLYWIGKYSSQYQFMDYILNKKALTGAKVGIIASLMLGIKENLVDNKGNLVYKSKIFLNSLERSILFIATKVEDGYKIGNYFFPDAASAVAIIRNKLAHGKYKIDFSHNRVILEHKGIDIVINIDKLTNFIMMSFMSMTRDSIGNKYERDIICMSNSDILKKHTINNLSFAKTIIKSYRFVKFTIESIDGLPVFEDCITCLENFIKYYRINPELAMKSEFYTNMVNYLKRCNCKLSVDYMKLENKDDIDRLLKFVDREIISNEGLNYEQKIKIIGEEVHKYINDEYRNYDIMAANIYNLILLSAITKTGSISDNMISAYLDENNFNELKFGYDEFGAILIGMFNSLFIYPFDDVYDTSGEYTVNRENSFDFSTLDLSMVKPSVITIDDAPLVNALARCDSLNKKQLDITQKINNQKNNIAKVKGNPSALAKINNNINDLQNSLTLIIAEYLKADSEYNVIKDDYTVNNLYFYNKAIIEGIRNSIAHGNYEFKIDIDTGNIFIVFSDIYEGKVTFKTEILFDHFEDLIDNNYDAVLNYVRNKINDKGRTI